MRPRENYSVHVAAGLVLTAAILFSFQLYIWREPARIAEDEQRDQLIAVTAGRALFAENCAMCHGEEGEGVDGPPLNDKSFLASTSDEAIFSLVGSGVPGTEMPAWNQSYGGPFTDEQIRQLVDFIRAWEPTAPDRQAMAMAGDPVEGLIIFNSTCIVCHGENGQGTQRAPALNDPAKLTQFDDEWYVDTISSGRPAQGMPTWGTVLSPVEIHDLVALVRAWQRGETVSPPGAEVDLAEAHHMLEHGDLHAVEHALERAAQKATGDVLTAINEALEAVETGDAAAVEAALERAQDLLGASGQPMDEHMEGMDHD